MTPRDASVVAAIKGLTREHGRAPSIREVARHVRIAPSNALRSMRSLREQGVIHFEDGHRCTAALLVEYEGHRPDIIARIGDDALDALVRNALAEQSRRQASNVHRLKPRLRTVA